MNHSAGNETLTTSQAGDLLGVHPSTVKRWCDGGELPSARTGGGHRRVALEDLLEFARQREIETFLTPFHPFEAHVWEAVADVVDRGAYRTLHDLALGWMGRGRVDRVGRLFSVLGRHSGLSFGTFCDEGIRGFMRLVGDQWQAGKLRVGEEHMVSQALMESLLSLRSGKGAPSPAGEAAPVALVGCSEGDQHHLGALCVRLLLERRGWKVHYLGAAVPFEDFAAMQRRLRAGLVCVSFSPPGTGGDVLRCLRLLRELHTRSADYVLALGGEVEEMPEVDGASEPFRAVGTFASCTAFDAALESGFAEPPSRGHA